MDGFGAIAGAGLVQAGLGYYQGLRGEQLQRDTNALNYSMWQKQLEYDRPVNQRARLEEAGLNPALMYGNGSVANLAPSPQRAEAPSPRGYNLDPGVVVQMQQARLAGQQAEVAREQARALKLQNDATPAGASPRDSAPMRAAAGVINKVAGPDSRAAKVLNSVVNAPSPAATLRESITPAWMQNAWKWMKKAGESVGPKYQMRGR